MFKFDNIFKSASTNIFKATNKLIQINSVTIDFFQKLTKYNTRTWVIKRVNLLIEMMSN